MKQQRTGRMFLAVAALLVAGTLTAHAGSRADEPQDDGVIKHAVQHSKVRLALLENVGTDALRINIDVNGSDVDLKGTVHNRSTVELARRIAQSVEGVETVDVDLEVAENGDGALDEASSELSDTILATKVKMALLAELGMGGFKINVDSADGVVALSGELDKEDRREAAVATAKDVAGVKQVRDLLKAQS